MTHARARCWIHEDCLDDFELSTACGPNTPNMQVLDADWVVDQGGGWGNGNGIGYGNGIGIVCGGNGYGYGFAGDGGGDGGDGEGGGDVEGGRR